MDLPAMTRPDTRPQQKAAASTTGSLTEASAAVQPGLP
jgi:hypothetical protein